MLKTLALYSVMFVTLLTGLSFVGHSTVKSDPANLSNKPKPQISITFGQPRRRRWRANNRWYYGYRNYGQYRRTQVGWRNRTRYRMFPEYYYDGRRRRVRQVRYYYRF